MAGRRSIGVFVAYSLLLLLILFLVAPELHGIYVLGTLVLLVILVFYLARYLSVYYTLDDTHFRAHQILGGRRIPFEEIRAIEYGSLRDLSPTGGIFSTWVGRGKMYSPTIGEFDAIYTEPARGLLVGAGAYPLYISPADRDEFARELSRRVRSYTGPLLKDVGYPGD